MCAQGGVGWVPLLWKAGSQGSALCCMVVANCHPGDLELQTMEAHLAQLLGNDIRS